MLIVDLDNFKVDVEGDLDYDLYNDKQFYHNLYGWEYNAKVDKITSTACYMNKDIVIELK